jgi:hypothetical protein
VGTAAADINVGISVHTEPADIQNAERAGEAVNRFVATVEQSRQAIARAGNDFTKFKAILLELVTAQSTAATAAKTQAQAQSEASSATAAAASHAALAAQQRAAAQKAALDAEVEALRAAKARELDLVAEAERQQTVTATNAQEQRMALVERFAREEQALRARFAQAATAGEVGGAASANVAAQEAATAATQQATTAAREQVAAQTAATQATTESATAATTNAAAQAKSAAALAEAGNAAALAAQQLRTEAATPVNAAGLVELRAQLDALEQDETTFHASIAREIAAIQDGVRQKLLTEEQGEERRLAALDRFGQQSVALEQRYAKLRADAAAAGIQAPGRASGGAPTAATPTQAAPDVGGQRISEAAAGAAQAAAQVEAVGDAAQRLATDVNVAIGRFVELGKTIDVANEAAVRGFRAEAGELSRVLDSLGVEDAQLRKILNAVTLLEQRAGAAIARTEQEVASANLAPATEPVERYAAEINVAIGAFKELAKTVDVTDAASVAAFRARGEAVAAEVQQFGAARRELSAIEQTIAQVERSAGAATVRPTPITSPTTTTQAAQAAVPVPNAAAAEAATRRMIALQEQAIAEDERRSGSIRKMALLQEQAIAMDQRRTVALQAASASQAQAAQATTQAGNAAQAAAAKTQAIVPPATAAAAAVNKIPTSARSAANALSIISLSAATGTGSLSGLANAAGTAAFGLSQLSGNTTLVAGAAGFGALVTVVGVLIGLYETFSRRQQEVNKNLGDLTKNIGGLGLDAIQGRLAATQQTIDRLNTQREALDRKLEKGIASPIGLIDVVSAEREIGRVDTRLRELFEQRDKLQTASAEAATAAEKAVTDRTIRANEDALESYLRRTRGEAAARRQQITFEEQAAIAEARTSGDREGKREAEITSIRKRFAEERAQIDAAESERIAKARTDNETRLAKIAGDTQVAASKEAFDKQEAANAEQRARRLISEREFIQTRETLALESIGREEHARLEAIDREIAAQQRLLAATTEPEKRTAVQGQLTALTDQRNTIIAGAREQSARVQAQATQDTADLARRLADTITESTAKTLEAQGHLVEAASTRINRQFNDLIREAEKAGNAVGAAVLRAERDTELERANVEQLTTGIGRATTASENQIARVNSLLAIHAITTRQAREQIVGALTSERDAIAQSIPLLEAQAAKLPGGDPETLTKIDTLTTKIAELNAEIAKTGDPLFELKETARNATRDAVAGFLEGLTKLGTQDRSQIKALTGDLQAAQQELTELLAIPGSQRSGEVNTRIDQLRGQIAATTAQLDQAKQSITSWRDLFVSALQSIADALVKVSSQMLATALIEKLLGIGAGSFGGVSPTQSGGPVGTGGVANVATGGFIRGPGTSTSDSIPARLSNGEFVVNAARTARFLPLLHAINFDPEPPPIVLPKVIRHYAAGGYVQPLPTASTQASGAGASGALDRLHVTLDGGLLGRMIRDYMSGTEGREIIVKHVRGSDRQLGIR